MSTVLVIGNGFDLALGYDSAYSHFANTWAGSIRHFYWPFKNSDDSKFQSESLHQYFFNYFISQREDNGSVRWLDIETELYNYAKSKQGKRIPDNLVSQDKWSFDCLVRSLHHYLLRHEELKYKYIPPKGEDKCIIELLKALRRDRSFNKVYSFNYTDLKKRLIKYGEFIEGAIPQIKYVHGSIGIGSETNPQIVLGINADSSIPIEYSFLQKINNPYADAGDLAKDLADADEIIFYGLSMGIVDFEYFSSFFHNVVNAPFTTAKKHITIFTRGEKNVYSIGRNISDMGVALRDLKEHAHFNIIDSHEAEFDDNGHYTQLHKLIDRLISK